MIPNISFNTSFRKWPQRNKHTATLDQTNNHSDTRGYNPCFYPILPKQVSFCSAQSTIVEELKLQKLNLIFENTNMVNKLSMFKQRKEEVMVEILKEMGVDIDTVERSTISELLSLTKAEIRKQINDNFDGISFLDSKIQKESGKYYDGLDTWEMAMDKEVPGFPEVKKNLLNQYLKPILEERTGVKARVPSGVVLYGPEGMMKEDFVVSLAQRAASNIEYISPNSDNFIPEIELILNNAKKIYQEDKTRTILCIDKIDELASPDPKNEHIVDYLKTRLDNCSKTPDEHNQGHATTFFFMASDPNKIHKDLRREKIGDFIGINPTNTDYIKNVFKFKLNDLDIDSNVLDYEELIPLTKPDEVKGAFSADALDKIFDIAVEVALDDKRYHFQSYLEFCINKVERDITPEQYKKIKAIENKIEPPEHSQEDINKLKKEMGLDVD